MKSFKYLILLFLAGLLACTDLTEELKEDLTAEQAEENLNANVYYNALLKSAYYGLRLPYQDQAQYWAAMPHTTD